LKSPWPAFSCTHASGCAEAALAGTRGRPTTLHRSLAGAGENRLAAVHRRPRLPPRHSAAARKKNNRNPSDNESAAPGTMRIRGTRGSPRREPDPRNETATTQHCLARRGRFRISAVALLRRLQTSETNEGSPRPVASHGPVRRCSLADAIKQLFGDVKHALTLTRGAAPAPIPKKQARRTEETRGGFRPNARICASRPQSHRAAVIRFLPSRRDHQHSPQCNRLCVHILPILPFFAALCQCRDKTPAILPVLPIRGGGNLGGDAVGTLQ
jgi:hypothetical protein